MESVEKISVRMGSDDCEAKSIGKVDGTLQRYCRWLQAAVDAYGADWLDADHVAAWTKGGQSSAANCQVLCKTHNRAKGNR